VIERPLPGTDEADIFPRLVGEMSRAGRRVDLAACSELARDIVERGHANRAVRRKVRALGIDSSFLRRVCRSLGLLPSGRRADGWL
jgi:hypothetical protein